jgi:hypothetical protein
MLFASGLILEREPLSWADLPAALAVWLRDAGYVAAFGLLIWGIAFLLQRPQWARKLQWSPKALLFTTAVAASAAFYAFFGLLLLIEGTIARTERNVAGREITVTEYTPLQNLCLSVAGALALLAVIMPIVIDIFTRLRWRRIWALARLSIKEAWSRGVVWLCLIIPLLYLYADYYLDPARPEEQLSQRVKIAYFAMTMLFVVTAILLGSFNIPTDVRNQTIHTIVTKPVERYEIVLGRFTGYALLLFLEMVGLTAISIVYVSRGKSEAAVQETYTARRPLFAKAVEFYGTANKERGESVGREWNYRGYISGAGLQPGAPQQYIRFFYPTVPGDLADRDDLVRMEFTFDIFRTTKGEERVQGVHCSFLVADGRWSPPEVEELVKRSTQELNKRMATIPRTGAARSAALAKLESDVAVRYGVYARKGVVVTDYHTQALEVPAALFKKLATDAAARPGDAPALQVLVTMEKSAGPQLLGVARRDLYFLASEGWFELNFAKGAIGLWLGACMVLGIALACSTYLSAVISLLATAFLCGLGLFRDYVSTLAAGKAFGGGPFEAAHRLATRQGMVMDLPKDTTTNILQALDQGYFWFLRRVLSAIPDVSRFDLTTYVASGFDISWDQVLFADTLLPLLGYLLPCAILAYYLMNAREIANPT